MESVPSRIRELDSHDVAKVRQEYADQNLVPNELIVRVESNESGASLDGEMKSFAQEYGARVLERFDRPKSVFKSAVGEVLRLELPPGLDYAEAVAAMRKDQRVHFAEPNRVFKLEEVEKSESASPSIQHEVDERLWGLDNRGQTGGTPGADVSAKEAWAVNTGDRGEEGPLIAVIDTGIDYNHPDLNANMARNSGEIPGNGIDDDENGVVDDVYGYNAYADNGDPLDGNSHGTHVAGTIAGVGDDGQGITGVMHQAKLLAVKIFTDDGSTSTDAIVRGLAYAGRRGADITNNSWGGNFASDAIFEAFKENDALHVVAAGNDDRDNDLIDYFPANYDLDNILVVAATNHKDDRASFSQWGNTKVDVAAPGRDIYSTVPGGGYETYSGTSMATPHVAGGAGLVLSQYPEASVAEVKNRLIHGSDFVNGLHDLTVSDGRVNFATSLKDDKVAPGAPNDFKLAEVSSRTGTLSWTSVGDDRWANGAAPRSEVFVSQSPITSENLAEASSTIIHGASEVGDLKTHRVHFGDPVDRERPVHFAMRSVDKVGNFSELRVAQGTIPAALVPFSEDFEEGDDGFQAEGFNRVQVAGRGMVYSSAKERDEGGGRPGRTVATLVSSVIDLTESQNSFLRYEYSNEHRFLEGATMSISEDGGRSWLPAQPMEAREQGWQKAKLDLSAFDGKKIQVKFESNMFAGRQSPGLLVDNMKVLAESPSR